MLNVITVDCDKVLWKPDKVVALSFHFVLLALVFLIRRLQALLDLQHILTLPQTVIDTREQCGSAYICDFVL